MQQSSSSFPFGPHADKVLERRYLIRDAKGRVSETSTQMLERVAGAVAQAEVQWEGEAGARTWTTRFLEFMQAGLFLPNSPTLMNAGRPPGPTGRLLRAAGGGQPGEHLRGGQGHRPDPQVGRGHRFFLFPACARPETWWAPPEASARAR